MSGSEGQLLDEISRLRPAEVLIPELPSGQPHDIAKSIQALGINAITVRPGWQFTPHHAREEIRRQWQLTAVAGLGFGDDDPAIFATAAILSYLQETQKTSLSHVRPPKRHVVEDHLAIDPSSWRSLEIDRTGALRRRRGLAAERHRSHAHHDGRPAAAPVASLPAERH
jgi:DNA mismatch repair protein MutS